MSQWSKKTIGGIVIFILGLVFGYAVKPVSTPDIRTSDASVSDEGSVDLNSDLEADPELMTRITNLQRTVSDLRRENAELNDRLQSPQLVEGDPAHVFGVSAEYVKGLPYEGLSQNLMVTTEGQVVHGISKEQAATINIGLKTILEEFRQWEAMNAVIESETEEELVLAIPAQEAPVIKKQIQDLFIATLGEDRGQSFFHENSSVMSRSLSGYGQYTRIVRVTDRPGDGVDIYDSIISPDGQTPFSGRTGIQDGIMVPLAYKHLLELAKE